MARIAKLEGPHLVDRHVGRRVEARRRELGLTQTELSRALGVTFQQVQKYEIGASRISASKLHAAAIALRMPVGAFFEGLDEAAGDDCGELETVVSFLHTLEGFELARRLLALSEGRRRAAIALIAALAEQEGGAEG